MSDFVRGERSGSLPPARTTLDIRAAVRFHPDQLIYSASAKGNRKQDTDRGENENPSYWTEARLFERRTEIHAGTCLDPIRWIR